MPFILISVFGLVLLNCKYLTQSYYTDCLLNKYMHIRNHSMHVITGYRRNPCILSSVIHLLLQSCLIEYFFVKILKGEFLNGVGEFIMAEISRLS